MEGRRDFCSGHFPSLRRGHCPSPKNLSLGIKFSSHTMAGRKELWPLAECAMCLGEPFVSGADGNAGWGSAGATCLLCCNPRERLNSHILPTRAWKGCVFRGQRLNVYCLLQQEGKTFLGEKWPQVCSLLFSNQTPGQTICYLIKEHCITWRNCSFRLIVFTTGCRFLVIQKMFLEGQTLLNESRHSCSMFYGP